MDEIPLEMLKSLDIVELPVDGQHGAASVIRQALHWTTVVKKELRHTEKL